MKEIHIDIPVDSVTLKGILRLPKAAESVIIFAHGSGSSRLSPRNTFAADVLNRAGFATLLFDLLTEDEDAIYENRFNINLLAERLKATTAWVKKSDSLHDFKIGYFGASTGAAAAIIAAADLGGEIFAVISRGGRPDLAGGSLGKIKAPTLLIVGGLDETVIELNRQAAAEMNCVKKLTIIPGATHLFEEPGTLESAAGAAAEWFKKYAL